VYVYLHIHFVYSIDLRSVEQNYSFDIGTPINYII